MSFVGSPISGKWWRVASGRKRMQQDESVVRGPRRLRVMRYVDSEYRTYANRTDGSDGNVIDPDSWELWNDPMEGEPTSSVDWLVTGAEVDFNIDTGMVEAAVSSVKVPADWEGSVVVSRREFL